MKNSSNNKIIAFLTCLAAVVPAGVTKSSNNKIIAFLTCLAAVLLAGVTETQAAVSAYVSEMGDAADQMIEDIGGVLPLGLNVAVISVGIFIVWRVFKRLAKG